MRSFRFLLFIFPVLALPPALALAQDNSDPYYKAGNTLYGQKNYAQAIRYYQAALQLNPNKWEAEQGMGNCYYAQGDKPTALTHYQKALAVNPNNPQLSAFVQSLQAQVGTAPAAQPAFSAQPTPVGPQRNPNLPKDGGIVLEGALSDWLGSWQEIQDLYGGGTYTGTPMGVNIELGAAYSFMPNFQAGLKLHGMIKQPEQVYNSFVTITFNENVVGIAAEGEATIPIDAGINFLGTAQAGYFTMVGSTVTSTASTNSDSLSGSGMGGCLLVGGEFLLNSDKNMALDCSLGYQFLSISPVTATPQSGTAYTVNKSSGGNWAIDFSGPEFSMGVRFF